MKKTALSFTTLFILAIGFMSFTSTKTSGESGFYYCYIKGYYNGDQEDVGYVYSSIEEFKTQPQTSCSGWKDFVEQNERHFTAICSSYALIGPFSFSHQAHASMQKKIKTKKDAGYKTSEWNKGPRNK